MILDTSYTDKKITKAINDTVGPSFGWKERFKLGGIGSKRMEISRISDDYQSYLNAAHYISNANIELRPKGILIHFRHKLQAYSWIMPYAKMKITYEDSLRLESEGHFIQFDSPENEKFIQKLLELAG
ncbi:MAG: hypothetical protein HRT61_11980 [Ekhidna sp.]|nr:hypothetical protein [Ekhidna sp.]